MLGCRPSAFPFEQRTKLDKGEEKARVDSTQYGRLVGQLLYLQATRPNIKYVVNVLSQFVAGPRKNHSKATNRVLRYLKGTPGQGILLPPDGPSNLTAYCDSDWLGCPFTRLSRTEYISFVWWWSYFLENKEIICGISIFSGGIISSNGFHC